uniref:ATP-dependent Clp protease 1 n=1 Tax=Babesia duncani TaxID=323732 RepID=A0A385GNK4_9APIC|nr:ATP-dependent Clp protease 1 [Babesia duncani]
MIKFIYFLNNKRFLFYIYEKYRSLKYLDIFSYFIDVLKKLNTPNYKILLNIEKLIEVFIKLNKKTIYILDIAPIYNFNKFLKFIKFFFKFKYNYNIYKLIEKKLLEEINININDLKNLEIIYTNNKIILIFSSIILFLTILINNNNKFNNFKKFFNNFNIYIVILDNSFSSFFINEYIKNNNLKYKVIFKDCKLSSYTNTLAILRNVDNLSLKKFIDFKIDNNNIFNIDYINYINIILPYLSNLIFKVNETNIYNIIKYFKRKLYNQDELINLIFGFIKSMHMKKESKKPIKSWLLCGPSGTGKTELAKILAHILFKSNKQLIRFNMSEYMEAHSVSKLIGSPPGYVGYGEKGEFISKLQSDSSYIILFDEIEKAHSSIYDLMLQILDEGRLTLSNQEIISFDKTFIIFTSNLGFSNNSMIRYDNNYNNNILKSIENYFRPEFLNRLNDIIIFKPIDNFSYYFILDKFIRELTIKYKFNSIYLNSLKFELIKYNYNSLYGLRPLKRNNENIFYKFIIYNSLLNKYYFYYRSNLLYNLSTSNIICKYTPYIYI